MLGRPDGVVVDWRGVSRRPVTVVARHLPTPPASIYRQNTSWAPKMVGKRHTKDQNMAAASSLTQQLPFRHSRMKARGAPIAPITSRGRGGQHGKETSPAELVSDGPLNKVGHDMPGRESRTGVMRGNSDG